MHGIARLCKRELCITLLHPFLKKKLTIQTNFENDITSKRFMEIYFGY